MNVITGEKWMSLHPFTSNSAIALMGGGIGLVLPLVYSDYYGVVIVASIVYSLSAWIMQKTIRVFNIHHMTITAFLYLTFSFTIFIPSLFVIINHPSPYIYTFLLSIMSFLIAVPLGILLINIVLQFDKDEIRTYFEKSIEDTENNYPKTIFIVFLALCIMITISYIIEAPTIPLFALFVSQGQTMELALLREDSLKLLDSQLRFLYHLLRDTLYPFLIAISLGYWFYTRQISWTFLFLGTFSIGLLYAAFSLARLPPTSIFIIISIMIYIFYGGKVGKKLLVIGSIVALAFPFTVTLLTKVDATVFDVFETVFERIVLAPANILYYYYEVVPEQVDFLFGRTLGKMTWIVGSEYFDISNFVGRYIAPQGLETVSANAAFIGDLYANFGLFGVFFGSVVIGILVQGIQIHLLRDKKTVFNVAAYAFLMYEFSLLNILPFSSVLIFSGMPLLIAILYLKRDQ